MAEYGVNIAVAVKNSQAVTQLSNKIKETALRIEDINNRFNIFANVTGKVLPGSIANFNKALRDAAQNLSDVALNTDDAVASAREFARAQDLANDALREQAALLARVRNEGRSGTLRGGTQYSGPIGPGPASLTALRSPLPPSVPVALRSPMRPQSLLPQMGMTAQAGRIASDMKEVYASILRLTEKANKEEAQKLQTLRQGTQEVEELAQKYRAVNETRKTEKQIQLEIRRSILETKNAAAEQARVESEAFMDRLRNLKIVGAKRREQFIEFNNEENEKRRIRERELDFEIKLANIQDRRERRRRAASSALIGGAFPLLFGQGPGAAVGGGLGGFGGGMIGGEFGFGLSLIGTQLGSIIDQFVNKISDLAGSLDSTESIFSALEEAGFKVNEVTKEIVASYEQAGLFTDAYQLAIDELNSKLGDDGAAKLQAYQDELDRVGNLFEELQSDLMSELLPALTGTLRLILGLKNAFDTLAESPLFKALAGAGGVANFVNPGLAFFGLQFKAIQALGAADEDIRVPDSVRRKQEAGREVEIADEIARNQIASERGIILDKQLDLAKAGNDLLNKDVQLAREKLIDEKYLAAVRGDDVTLGEKILAGKQRALDVQRLANEISAAETAELKRQKREQKKISDEADVERRRKEKAFKRNEEALLRLQQRGQQQREAAEMAQVQRAGDLIDKLSAQKALREAILNGTEEEVKRQQRIEQLMEGQEDGMRSIVENYVDLEIAQNSAIDDAQRLNSTYASIGRTIETGVVDMIMAATDKTKSLAEAASNTLRQLASQLLSFGINAGLGSLGGDDGVGFFSRLFPRALGGSVSSNRPYMVGERGPELFVPGAQGNIVPNHAMGSSNIVVNVDASGTQAQGDQPSAKALGSAIGAAVQAELIKQKRPGGLLA